MTRIRAWVVAIHAAVGPEPGEGHAPIVDRAAMTSARRAVEVVLPPRHRWAALFARAALRALGRRLARPATSPAGRDACRP
jgi:hypothetical protein